MLSERIIALIIFLVLGGLYAYVKGRPLKRAGMRRLSADANFATMVQWAERNQWTCVEGIDLQYAEVAERITAMIGIPPSKERDISPASQSDEVPSLTWVFGPILVRDQPQGTVIVFDAWYEEDSKHNVFAAIETDQVFEPYFLDVHDDGRFEEEGKAPHFSDEYELRSALAGLPLPARIRFSRKHIVIHTPGELSGDLVEQLATRLGAVVRSRLSVNTGPMR